MSSQEKLEVFEVTLRCNNANVDGTGTACDNIHREVTSDVFASIYKIVCAKCGHGGFTLLKMENLLGSGPTKFSFE